MKKKSYFIPFLLLAMLSVACSSDDDNTGGAGSNGASGSGCYILNQGLWGGNDASIQYYNFETSLATSPICTQDLFYSNNNSLLGDVAQDMLWINEKLYVTVSSSQKLEILDEQGRRLCEPYTYAETMACPRMMATDGEYLYVVNYDKNIYAYDIDTDELVKTIPVGSYPEGISYVDGYLVVSNSDYGACDGDASLSVVDVNSGIVREIKEYICNPGVQSVACNGDVYIIDQGNYSTIGSNILRINPRSATVETLGISASLLAVYENTLYYVNASWNYNINDYAYSPLYRYDTVSGETVELLSTEVMKNVNSLSVNPENGDIYVGYSNGTNLGNMRVFAADGTQQGVFDVGLFTCGARFEIK